jgi:hypothetical protein
VLKAEHGCFLPSLFAAEHETIKIQINFFAHTKPHSIVIYQSGTMTLEPPTKQKVEAQIKC